MDQPDSVITNINQIITVPSNNQNNNSSNLINRNNKLSKDNNLLSNQSTNLSTDNTINTTVASKRPKSKN